MPVSADTLRLLMQSGISGQELIDIVASIDRDMCLATDETDPVRAAKKARNARYYQGQKLKAASESPTEKRLNKTPDKTPETRLNSSESVLIKTPPRAHVRDNNPTKVISGKAVVVVSADARETDDWPETDPSKALIAEVASPWLDPMKTPGLVLTAARVSAWRREGASWRDDVIPVVMAACQRRKSAIQSWQFFDAAIAQSIANNRAGLTIPEARAGPSAMTFAERLGAENAEARRLAFARMDAEDARNAARQQT